MHVVCYWQMAWLNGSVLVSINVDTLCRAQLVL